MDLKYKTISGIQWTASSSIAKSILQFIISIVLARLLMPKDFGLIGIIVVLVGFASLFSEMGFGQAIIQRKKIEERHLSTIFWLNIVIGIFLSCCFIAIAPLIAKFYNEPQLKMLVVFISFTFIIGSTKIVQSALLNRYMKFRRLAYIEITTQIISAAVAITLASAGFGVWSLAWQIFISTTISAILLWKVTEWNPCFKFEKKALKELLGFSSNLLGFKIFNYWARNVDDLLIGKFIGTVGLGLYTRSYGLMLIPLNQISTTVGKVMFSSLSKIQDNVVHTRKIYLKTISAIALLTMPMMTGLMVVADSFVIALLGPAWVDVIRLLRILCLTGMVQSVGTTVGWIYSSQGRTDLMLRWGIAAGTILIAGFIVGVWIGSLQAVAVSYAITVYLLQYHNFTIPGRLINMTFYDVFASVKGILCCSIVMAAGVFIIGLFIPDQWSHWPKLIIQTFSGVIIYIVIIHAIRLKAYEEVKVVFWENVNRKNSEVVQQC